MDRLTIVGIDIGITTGIAILDTNGKILSVDSKREMKKDEIVKTIIKFGKPLIIASDVNPLPKSIENIISEFGSRAFIPERSLSVEEKLNLTKDYHRILKNDHEKDALAAALKAWKNYKDLFSKISIAMEEVTLKIFRKESENIENAIREVLKEKLVKVEEPEKRHKEIKSLEKKLREKESQIRKLRLELKNISLKRRFFPKMDFFAMKMRELKEEVERLKQANNFLKKFMKLRKKDFTLSSNSKK